MVVFDDERVAVCSVVVDSVGDESVVFGAVDDAFELPVVLPGFPVLVFRALSVLAGTVDSGLDSVPTVSPPTQPPRRAKPVVAPARKVRRLTPGNSTTMVYAFWRQGGPTFFDYFGSLRFGSSIEESAQPSILIQKSSTCFPPYR